MIIEVYIYPTPLSGAISNTRPIFKRPKAGLISELTFSKTGCCTETKEPSLFNYFFIAEGRRIHAFPKGISGKIKCSLVQNLNSGHRYATFPVIVSVWFQFLPLGGESFVLDNKYTFVTICNPRLSPNLNIEKDLRLSWFSKIILPRRTGEADHKLSFTGH